MLLCFARLPLQLCPFNQEGFLEHIFQLFWIFLKVNLLSTSGSASIGLLYNEMVGSFLTEEQFVQAVGLATLLPGSDALQLAMFIGYTVGGIPGGFVSLFAAILPPTVIMFGLVSVLHRIQRQAWVSRFVEGLTPAVAVLILTVAWKVVKNGMSDGLDWRFVGLGITSLIAYLFELPAPLVVLVCGLVGTFLFR
jgi:chromate transporter